jgi:anti-sigma factor RsiW
MLTCDEIRDLAPAYVLGALERDEEAAVTEHLRTCPDVHREVAELGEMTAYLDETIPLVEPPASLRGRILAAAADDLATRQAADAPAPAVTTPTPKPAPLSATAAPARTTSRETADRVISLDDARARRRNWGAWVVGLAAVLAIVALGAWNVSIQQQLNDTRTYQQRLSAALAQAGQPGSQVAVLASTTPGSGLGGIAVMPATGNGSLVVTGLAPTTGTQVYEAWAILQGQPPTPVAGFKVGADGVGYFDKMPSATGETLTVAITLEPQPNPSAPSSAPIAAGIAAPPTEVG